MDKQEVVSEAQVMPPANIIVLGLPGSGKTTLGELMALNNPELEYVSVGQISRDLPPGDGKREYVDSLYTEYNSPVGDPDFFVELVRPAIKKAKEEGKGIILDGLPKKPQEIDPLNKLLEEEGIKIDGVVICEVSPFTALQRVIARGPREGGLDTIDTAINRGEAYWKAVDRFKGKLGGFLGLKVVNVDTENMDPESAMTMANSILREIRLKEANANVIDIKTKEISIGSTTIDSLIEAFTTDEQKKASLLISELFVSDVSKAIIEKVINDESGREPLNIVQEVLDISPEYKHLPLAKDRYANMVINNVYNPLMNLVKVIPTETRLRSSEKNIERNHLENVVREALI